VVWVVVVVKPISIKIDIGLLNRKDLKKAIVFKNNFYERRLFIQLPLN
jgi:hypothetical protein